MRKTITIDGLAVPVILARRKGTRSVKLSISSDGRVRLSVPYGIPELAAKKFAASKVEWIKAHMKSRTELSSGMRIGKSHTLFVEHADISRPSSKISPIGIRVRLPLATDVHGDEAQDIIRKACEKALLQAATHLLPQRVKDLSLKHGITYRSLSVKKLKSRWGACDSLNNLSLNCYLIQLEWALIDYVICHELAHTIEHNHSDKFWDIVAHMQPHHKELRAELKSKPTDIIAA